MLRLRDPPSEPKHVFHTLSEGDSSSSSSSKALLAKEAAGTVTGVQSVALAAQCRACTPCFAQDLLLWPAPAWLVVPGQHMVQPLLHGWWRSSPRGN